MAGLLGQCGSHRDTAAERMAREKADGKGLRFLTYVLITNHAD